MLNLTNFLTVIPSIPLLAKFGRKQLMVSWTLEMTSCLVVMTVFTVWVVHASSPTIELIALLFYIGGFEMSFGPVVWLYLSEVLNDKQMSIAIFANWTMSLAVGLLTPYLFLDTWLGNYTFLLYGIFCFIGFLYCLIFMKETKGKTEAECKSIYRSYEVNNKNT
jgi:MFS family permease